MTTQNTNTNHWFSFRNSLGRVAAFDASGNKIAALREVRRTEEGIECVVLPCRVERGQYRAGVIDGAGHDKDVVEARFFVRGGYIRYMGAA